MKKFTKVLAAFCAMAMIFGTFSATVLADEVENPADQPAAEEVAEEEKKDEEPAAEEPADEEPAAEEQADEEPAVPAEDPDAAPAEAEAPAQDSAEQPDIEQQVEVADVPGVAAVNEGETASPFANGEITQAAIDANGGELPETTGTYTLVENVSVPGHSHIDAAGTQITIDLNGHTITYTGTENLYTIGSVEDVVVDGKTTVLVHGDSVLTIKDTGSNGKIIASGTTKGSDDHWISINGNYPSHGTESYKRGGCILVQNSCTFILEGGTISGFHSESDGGAIHISNGGHVIMSGGRITDCHSDSVRPNDDGAGAISCHCTSKGTSIGNTLYKSSEDQEAVLTTVSLKGSLKITGGKIDNCSGKQGGAVRILRGDFEMTGGTIEDNTGLNGGGVLYNRNNKGSFKISGNAVISDDRLPRPVPP